MHSTRREITIGASNFRFGPYLKTLPLDTTYIIATPEGVELRLPVAGLASRALAWLIDAAIKIFVVFVAAIILQIFGNFGMGLQLISMFLLVWFYNILFEVLNHGATPGKRAVGVRVMNINGTPVGWTGSLIRNLIRFVDTLPGSYAFGLISMLSTRHFQRLGDLAAGTIVVYQPKKAATRRSGDVDPVAVTIPLTLDEQQAIVSYGDRAATLSHDRAEELAALMDPVFAEVDATQLQGYSNWLVGGERS